MTSLNGVDVLEVAQELGATYTLQKLFEIRTLISIVQNISPQNQSLANQPDTQVHVLKA